MPVYADLELHQGDDTTFRLEVLDSNNARKDLTGFSGAAKFKKTYGTSDSDAYSFNVTLPAGIFNGFIDLTLDGTASDDIKAGRYVYDVFLLKDSSSEKILEGKLEIHPSVTPIA